MSRLDRLRLRGNFLDQMEETRRRATRLERSAVALNDAGQLRLAGGLLAVQAAPPDPPPPGYVLIYAEMDTGVVHLRVMNDAGSVQEIASWV